MTWFVSGRDEQNPVPRLATRAGSIAPSWTFISRNKISPKSKPVHASFLSQNIFRVSKKIFCDFSIGMELGNEKTDNVTENENKENDNVNEFQEYTLQQK